MLVELLVGLMTDLVLGSAKTMRHSFDQQMHRYFEDSGFQGTPTNHTPVR